MVQGCFLGCAALEDAPTERSPRMSEMINDVHRRALLKGAFGAGAGLALAGPFSALGARGAEAGGRPQSGSRPPWAGRPGDPGRPAPTGDYGDLIPVRDQTTGLELIKLPKGFEYLTFGWTNDPLDDGTPTPGAHDGMAAFNNDERRGRGGRDPRRRGGRRPRHDDRYVTLVRNHERSRGQSFAPAGATYDAAAAGGTTNVVFDPDRGRYIESYASLSGTIRNCAGGPTPAGTWLTCEETTDIIDGIRHGYVFEVPSDGVAEPTPIKAMGRFSHEATATDPRTGIVYETEDSGSSAFYRYVPVDRDGLLEGGELQAMVLDSTTDTRDWATGASAAAQWVKVDNPDWGPGEATCWQQASAKGAARISRGEGTWYGNGVVYVVSTDGGVARQGQVFAYDPKASTFTCLFASPSADVLNAPDNICVSPRGGIVLCEDGSGREYLHGMTPDGDIFRFAENNVDLPAEFQVTKGYSGDYSGSEWAGATFEPKKGKWLFVNLQSPGITFAITGPWNKGAL